MFFLLKINDIIFLLNIISWTKLANELNVSRQIIVGDVAILKARGEDIISTARGYIYHFILGYHYHKGIMIKGLWFL